jgi:pimeloyl-ACP methyl ester carboxylesterase
MLTDETVPPEGARYAAPVVCVPGLWAGRDVWRRCATYLAHRGWECRVVDLRGAGALRRRAAELTAYLATLSAPAVVVGHDLGAVVATEAARGGGAAAVVMLAPLHAGAASRRLATGLRRSVGVALGRSLAPPGPDGIALLASGLDGGERAAVAARLAPDDGAALRDLLRRRLVPVRSAVPTLLVAGADDPLLPPPAAASLGAALGAVVRVVEGGHWLLGGAAWQHTADVVHRWLVQRLGEPLLEIYAETMAERDAEEE